MLSAGTQWDRLVVRPCDVPCVVKLGPLCEGDVAQTQPPLVGMMLLSSPCSPGWVWGPGSLQDSSPNLGWSKWMEGWLPKARHSLRDGWPLSSSNGLAGLGALFSARSSRVVRLCLFLCLSLASARKATTRRNSAFNIQPQAEEQADRVAATASGLLSGCRALGSPLLLLLLLSSVPVLPYPSAILAEPSLPALLACLNRLIASSPELGS